jgi:hypothetical protein
MAQPTRSDDQVVRRRLSHNNLRRKKWRRRQPRAERKRPRRSGRFSALTFGVLVEHPIFLSRVFPIAASCCSPDAYHARGSAHEARSPQRQADVPGGRVRWRQETTPQSTSEGRNPQWRRRRRAERRRRRRKGKFAAWRERGRIRVPFFVYRYRNVVPSQICTRRITSPG